MLFVTSMKMWCHFGGSRLISGCACSHENHTSERKKFYINDIHLFHWVQKVFEKLEQVQVLLLNIWINFRFIGSKALHVELIEIYSVTETKKKTIKMRIYLKLNKGCWCNIILLFYSKQTYYVLSIYDLMLSTLGNIIVESFCLFLKNVSAYMATTFLKESRSNLNIAPCSHCNMVIYYSSTIKNRVLHFSLRIDIWVIIQCCDRRWLQLIVFTIKNDCRYISHKKLSTN